MSWQEFTSRGSNNTPSIDFGQCADTCFAGAEQGLSAQDISGQISQQTGVDALNTGFGLGA